MDATTRAPAARLDLGPTAAHKRREVLWYPCDRGRHCPCDGVMVVVVDKKHTGYRVTETFAGPGYGPGRAFRVRKAGGPARDVFVSAAGRGHTCDCEGHTYETSRKAAFRAAERGEVNRYVTAGCVHLDSLLALIDAGHLSPRTGETT